MKQVTVRQALQNVADYPVMVDDDYINLPVHELVARSLFEIANTPDASVRGAMSRANKARKMILDRMVGKRRAGSHPATRTGIQVEFLDLTGGEINGATTGREGDPPDDGGDGGSSPAGLPGPSAAAGG